MQLKGKLKAVIFDWAGTTVDFGCIAPTRVFVDVLQKKGIEITMADARGPMGLAKKEHLNTLLKLDKVQEQIKNTNSAYNHTALLNQLYEELEPALATIVKQYAKPIPGAVELQEQLRANGVKIGSTTGYVQSMMKNVVPVAKEHGFSPDAIVTSSEVQDGRPKPWMCFLNAIKMDVFPMHHMVKVGDTVADIQEGLNAGMWTIGLTKSGNEIGLSLEDVENADPGLLSGRIAQAREKLLSAGAHYVVDGVWECGPLLQEIEDRMLKGEYPSI